MGQKLPRKFFEQSTLRVAKELLGLYLVHVVDGRRRVGRIVETEAYQGPEDLAAHSAQGRRTARNEIMYGPAGYAYVYMIYGLFHCLNVVTRKAPIPHAVLIRAIEPIENITSKTSGPGLLCKALSIDRSLNGADLRGQRLFIERPAASRYQKPRVLSAPRVGIDYSGPWANKPWRFYDDSSNHVSKRPRQLMP